MEHAVHSATAAVDRRRRARRPKLGGNGRDRWRECPTARHGGGAARAVGGGGGRAGGADAAVRCSRRRLPPCSLERRAGCAGRRQRRQRSEIGDGRGTPASTARAVASGAALARQLVRAKVAEEHARRKFVSPRQEADYWRRCSGCASCGSGNAPPPPTVCPSWTTTRRRTMRRRCVRSWRRLARSSPKRVVSSPRSVGPPAARRPMSTSSSCLIGWRRRSGRRAGLGVNCRRRGRTAASRRHTPRAAPRRRWCRRRRRRRPRAHPAEPSLRDGGGGGGGGGEQAAMLRQVLGELRSRGIVGDGTTPCRCSSKLCPSSRPTAFARGGAGRGAGGAPAQRRQRRQQAAYHAATGDRYRTPGGASAGRRPTRAGGCPAEAAARGRGTPRRAYPAVRAAAPTPAPAPRPSQPQSAPPFPGASLLEGSPAALEARAQARLVGIALCASAPAGAELGRGVRAPRGRARAAVKVLTTAQATSKARISEQASHWTPPSPSCGCQRASKDGRRREDGQGRARRAARGSGEAASGARARARRRQAAGLGAAVAGRARFASAALPPPRRPTQAAPPRLAPRRRGASRGRPRLRRPLAPPRWRNGCRRPGGNCIRTQGQCGTASGGGAELRQRGCRLGLADAKAAAEAAIAAARATPSPPRRL